MIWLIGFTWKRSNVCSGEVLIVRTAYLVLLSDCRARLHIYYALVVARQYDLVMHRILYTSKKCTRLLLTSLL